MEEIQDEAGTATADGTVAFDGGGTGGGPGRRQGADTDEGATGVAFAVAPAWPVTDKGAPAATFARPMTGAGSLLRATLGMLLAGTDAASVAACVDRCVREAACIGGFATATGCTLRGVGGVEVEGYVAVGLTWDKLVSSVVADSGLWIVGGREVWALW